jgi:hypothetical protein
MNDSSQWMYTRVLNKAFHMPAYTFWYLDHHVDVKDSGCERGTGSFGPDSCG